MTKLSGASYARPCITSLLGISATLIAELSYNIRWRSYGTRLSAGSQVYLSAKLPTGRMANDTQGNPKAM